MKDDGKRVRKNPDFRKHLRKKAEEVWVWRGEGDRKGYVIAQKPITGDTAVFGRDGRIIYEERILKPLDSVRAEKMIDDILSGGKLGSDMRRGGGHHGPHGTGL